MTTNKNSFFSDFQNLSDEIASLSLVKDAKGFNFKYCSLEQINAKIKPLLSKNNFILYFTLKSKTLVLTLAHSSGEKIESDMNLTASKPQDVGAEITYFKRYLIGALFNLVVSDDVDTSSAPARLRMLKQSVESVEAEIVEPLISNTQQIALLERVNSLGIEPKEAQKIMYRIAGVQSRKDLPRRMFDDVMVALTEYASSKAANSN
jgi:hypothetical protein